MSLDVGIWLCVGKSAVDCRIYEWTYEYLCSPASV